MSSFVKGVFLSLAFILLFVSCGEDTKKIAQKAEGSEGGPCYGNNTCNDDLVCEDGICVNPSEISDSDSGDSTDDGNTGNSGNTGDSGDTGNTGDSGDTGNSGNSGDSGDTGNTASDDDANTGDSGDSGDTGNTGDTGSETCGNGSKEVYEICDGGEIDCSEISDKYIKGVASCSDICQWDTSTCIEPGDTIKVLGGKFTMGCQKYDCSDFNSPSHEVTLSSFLISIFEVSVEEYENCLKAGACNNNDVEKKHYKTVSDDVLCNINSVRKNHPANCISWYGAKAYCEWKGMRLPTEAEWEFVASGQGEGWKYPFNGSPHCSLAVLDDSSDEGKFGCGKNSTWPIGSKPDNHGIFDLGGNVMEWCYDGSGNYSSEHVTDPLFNPDDFWQRIFRGSSFRSTIGLYDEYMECSQRYSTVPESISAEHGFRCAQYYYP